MSIENIREIRNGRNKRLRGVLIFFFFFRTAVFVGIGDISVVYLSRPLNLNRN